MAKYKKYSFETKVEILKEWKDGVSAKKNVEKYALCNESILYYWRKRFENRETNADTDDDEKLSKDAKMYKKLYEKQVIENEKMKVEADLIKKTSAYDIKNDRSEWKNTKKQVKNWRVVQ